MSATAERPAVASPPTPTPRPALKRVEGLDLLGEVSGSGYKDGAALVRRADGQMVQLGPLMYALLEAIDGTRDHAALAAAMSERLGRRVEVEHVARLGEKLWEQGLLAGSEANAPPRANPLLALRWKVLVTDPAVTRRVTAPFVNLFRAWVLLPVLAGFAVVCWFVLIHKGVASATAQAFHSPELLLLVLGLAIASAGFHEVGHASACRYGGGRPGGMGVGIYMVWPAFYTDVTDAYRLPRRARLRTDLGGLYFNAVIAVATLAVWLAVRADALLLLIALQLLEMVKQLSPVIRADGYHVLADATGVPDLYAHIGPTLRRLLPWRRREPSALTGRARVLVTAWVLVIVPVLLGMALTAILLLPKLAASTSESASQIASAIPHQAGDGQIPALLASAVRLFALALPVIGTVLMAQRLVRTMATKAETWSAGRPGRRAMVAMAAAALAALLAWAWWPSGQYQPVRASDHGTLLSATRVVASPASVARPQAQVAPVQLSRGKHLAVAMIPVGGATNDHPAIFVIKGRDGEKPAVIVSDKAPSTSSTPTATGAATTSATQPQGGGGETSSTSTTSSQAVAFPFTLPSKPGPNDSQALATNAQDGGIKYDIVYSVVTVTDGAAVDETNSAYALASCKACTTVAVSFQLVLVVGQSDTITPINVAEALNVNCPYCVTTAIADQIVLTVNSVPSDELLKKLTDELRKLNEIAALGAGGTPEAVAQQVIAVQHEIEQELAASGLVTNSGTTTSTTGTTPSSSSTSSTATTPSDGTSTTTAADPGTTTGTSTTSEDPQSGTAPTTTTPSSTQSTTTIPSSTSSTTPEPSTTDTEPTSTTPAPSSTTPTP